MDRRTGAIAIVAPLAYSRAVQKTTRIWALAAMLAAGCAREGNVDAGADASASRDGGADAGASDAGSIDAGSDAGSIDAGADAGSIDAGSTDAGADAGSIDAGADAGSTDAGSDAGSIDAGADAGSIDAGSIDAGFDAGASDAGDSDPCTPIPAGLTTWTRTDSASSGTPDTYFFDVTEGDPFCASITGGGSGAWSLVVSNGTSSGVYCAGSPTCSIVVPPAQSTLLVTAVTTDIGGYTLTVRYRPR